MKQIFQGHNQAISFAQAEAKKQSKKMFVYLIRANGVEYAVVDSDGQKTVIGKPLNEYGKDQVAPVIKPFIPPPPPQVIAPTEPLKENPVDPVVEIPDEKTKDENE